MFFFFKQKTAYELRISDWSSDVCSSDLRSAERRRLGHRVPAADPDPLLLHPDAGGDRLYGPRRLPDGRADGAGGPVGAWYGRWGVNYLYGTWSVLRGLQAVGVGRSEEHTSELQSLMRISYAVFCLKKQKKKETQYTIGCIN